MVNLLIEKVIYSVDNVFFLSIFCPGSVLVFIISLVDNKLSTCISSGYFFPRWTIHDKRTLSADLIVSRLYSFHVLATSSWFFFPQSFSAKDKLWIIICQVE